MNLKEFQFCWFKGETNEWSIEAQPQNGQLEQWLTLGDINLVVGKNASGKSRTINAIRHIADLVASDIKISHLNLLGYESAEYHLRFDDKEATEYHLEFKNGKITHEILSVGGTEKLNRDRGKLWYEGGRF